MIFFIVVLRALAACLITNAHYTGIYPTDLIANGGLIGDILFFAVSGYCLCNVKKDFFPWYAKRLSRIYPPVIIATSIYLLFGAYSLGGEQNFAWWFIYPTGYHFVGSMLLLYVPFWFVGKFEILRKKILWIMLGVGILYLLLYVFVYDKEYYHIDTVREPMIWFLFFESMLLGAYFRQKDEKYRNHFRWWQVCAVIFCAALYFISKLIFARGKYVQFQIVNQIIIFALLYFLFILFSALDEKLEKLPTWLKKAISFISERTLEIYVVQIVIIDWLRSYLFFPLNWIAITFSIIMAAWLLKYVCDVIEKGVLRIVKRLTDRKKMNEENSK